MPASEATQLTALVRAKDDAAELKQDVNMNTTLGELLRYWNWRESSDHPAEGFLLDLTIIRNEVPPAVDVDADMAERLSDSDVGPRIPASAKGKQKRLLSSDSEESDLQIVSSGKRKTPLQASTRINKPPAKRSAKRKSTVASACESQAPQAAHSMSGSTPSAGRSMRRSTINARRPDIQPDPVTGFVRVNGWNSGATDPQGTGFHVCFHFSKGTRRGIHYFVEPRARAEELCRAACRAAGVPHKEKRYLIAGDRMPAPGMVGLRAQREDGKYIVLIDDESATNQTVGLWGLQDGDDIDGFDPQYG